MDMSRRRFNQIVTALGFAPGLRVLAAERRDRRRRRRLCR